jgi:O-antigen ligase
VQARAFLSILLVTAFAVGVWGYAQLLSHGTGYRLSAPFEGKEEPNTLAGYLVFIVALSLGQVLYTEASLRRMRLLGLILFLLPVLVFTYSRGGYLSFFAMYLTLCAFSARNRLMLVSALAAGLALAPLILPHTVFERLADTFDPRMAQYQVGSLRLAHSPAARIFIWKYVVEKWAQHPFLGLGVTGIGFVDTQYGLLVGEVGIVGLLAFLFVQGRLWWVCFQSYRQVTEPLARGICLGFLAGHIGLLIHSFSGNVFIIVRIMEPFWFMAAVATVLPQVPSLPPVAVPKRAWRPARQVVHLQP